jgi:sn-glycerol 3-phosphate transport system substrate-binding protein
MIRLLLLCFSLALAATADAQEITLRHALSGNAQDALASLVLRFNDAQKGKARVLLESVTGVADKHQLPHLALLDDDDARDFFDTRPRFKPLADVMKEGGQKFDGGRFLPQIADAVDDLRGRPQALPMALMLPVLFYNRDAFAKAGLDPDAPPKTWWEVQQAAGKLFDAGQACPLTSSRFAWVHLENVSSQHSQPVVVRTGPKDRFAFDSLVHVKHIALLASWHKSRYFHYFGPDREGDARFVSGECAMLTGESGLAAELKSQAAFPFGVAELPYYEDVFGSRPGSVLPDGAALWTLPGKKKDEYKVVARFIAFLLQPEIQREWVRATGFLPMTAAALDALQAAGVNRVIVETARKRLSMPKQVNARSRIGFGRSRLRAILNEEMEFVWKNLKPAKEALDTAMQRTGDEQLPPRQ